MSEGNKVTEQRAADTAGERRRQPTTDQGFFSKSVVRRTLVTHVAAYLLVVVGILLLTRFIPDLAVLLGVEGELASVSDRVPAVANAVGGPAMIVLGLFAFLLSVFAGPIVAGIVGVAVGLKERAEWKTLTLASGLGGFVGYLLPIVTLFLLVDSQVPTASIGFGDALTNGIAMSLPSALVAAGMTYLTTWN